MNCIPRRDGRYSGLDHFGIEVEDLDDTISRMTKFDSTLGAVKRPPIRPFAAYSAHDPDTNIFDLSQKSAGVQKDVYAENDWVQPRSISHIALRTRHAERCAQFYVRKTRRARASIISASRSKAWTRSNATWNF
jgi:hypothetical protein